jgi:hypothetical protein
LSSQDLTNIASKEPALAIKKIKSPKRKTSKKSLLRKEKELALNKNMDAGLNKSTDLRTQIRDNYEVVLEPGNVESLQRKGPKTISKFGGSRS